MTLMTDGTGGSAVTRRTDQRRPRGRHGPAGRRPDEAPPQVQPQPAAERHLHRVRADRRCCSPCSPAVTCWQPQNISNIIVQNSYILILAIGMILMIIAGHIDLSVGSVVAAMRRVRRGADGRTTTCRGRSRCSITLVVGGADRRVAGLLGRVLRHPRVHRHPGRHAAVPGGHPDRSSATGASARSRTTVRTLANGFTDGYLGNIGLGALGGADLFSILVGVVAVAGIVVTQWRTRAARQQLRPGRRPAAAVRRQDRASPRSWSCSWSCSWPGSATCPGCWSCSPCWWSATRVLTNRAVFGRQIYAVGGNLQAATLSGVKVKSRDLLDLRQHGRAVRARRHHLRRPAQPGQPDRPATSSSWTPSRRPSSAAPPSRAASARSSAPSPAA